MAIVLPGQEPDSQAGSGPAIQAKRPGTVLEIRKIAGGERPQERKTTKMETTNLKATAVEPATPAVGGTKDGLGAADHDEPYRFGYRPSARWTYPFSAEAYCHLLMLRGRVQDGEFAEDMRP
jgi:hypothetical protein